MHLLICFCIVVSLCALALEVLETMLTQMCLGKIPVLQLYAKCFILSMTDPDVVLEENDYGICKQ